MWETAIAVVLILAVLILILGVIGAMWDLIIAIILGALVGAIARALVSSPVKGGCATDIVVGIIGSVVGDLALSVVVGHRVTGFHFLVALLGAMVFLVIVRALARQK